jgi:hypothetical protein
MYQNPTRMLAMPRDSTDGCELVQLHYVEAEDTLEESNAAILVECKVNRYIARPVRSDAQRACFSLRIPRSRQVRGTIGADDVSPSHRGILI